MRLVLQRVASASVAVEGKLVGEIGRGILALVAAGLEDGPGTAAKAARRIRDLRIFPDEQGRMNRSVVEVGGGVLVVSQFTLLGDTSKGRRPSFVQSAPGEIAEPLVQAVVDRLREADLPVAEGRFGAQMQVSLINDGPVTLILDV